MKKTDKTPRQLQEAFSVIAQQKALADALFLSIGEGAIATNKDGHIIKVNRATSDMLGYRSDELVGRWLTSAITLTDEQGNALAAMERPIARCFIEGKAVTSKCYIRRKDGTLLPVTATASSVMLEGKPVGAIEVFRDITQELAVDKIKSEFISLASHQLRTPATAVKTYIAMLLEGFAGKLTQKQRDLAKIAYSSNERQLHIVDDLLVIANTESQSLVLRKQPTDLRTLVREVARQQLDTIKKRHQELQIDLPAKSTPYDVDPSFFKMVIDNLLTNASKYTPEGGKLHIGLTRRKNATELKVTDNGVGIDPRERDKLFQKFTRIDNPLSVAAGGSGIGLYLLKQIVDLHGGDIEVKSQLGKGTTFTIKLPN